MKFKMKCDQLQKNPTAFLDNEYPPESLVVIGKHLRSCPTCSQKLFNAAFERLSPQEQMTFTSLVNLKKQQLGNVNIYRLLGDILGRTDEAVARDIFKIRQQLTKQLLHLFIGRKLQ